MPEQPHESTLSSSSLIFHPNKQIVTGTDRVEKEDRSSKIWQHDWSVITPKSDDWSDHVARFSIHLLQTVTSIARNRGSLYRPNEPPSYVSFAKQTWSPAFLTISALHYWAEGWKNKSSSKWTWWSAGGEFPEDFISVEFPEGNGPDKRDKSKKLPRCLTFHFMFLASFPDLSALLFLISTPPQHYRFQSLGQKVTAHAKKATLSEVQAVKCWLNNKRAN